MNEQNLTPMNLDGVSSILLNVYQKMIEDGTIEKIARDQIAAMIQGTLKDAMQWNGPARAAFNFRFFAMFLTSGHNVAHTFRNVKYILQKYFYFLQRVNCKAKFQFAKVSSGTVYILQE